jgi:hypothetical protein
MLWLWANQRCPHKRACCMAGAGWDAVSRCMTASLAAACGSSQQALTHNAGGPCRADLRQEHTRLGREAARVEALQGALLGEREELHAAVKLERQLLEDARQQRRKVGRRISTPAAPGPSARLLPPLLLVVVVVAAFSDKTARASHDAWP